MYVTDVSCSNGTIDYFRWDPDGGEGLDDPTISFAIAEANPHRYRWIVWFRSTSGEGTWSLEGDYGAYGEVDSGGARRTEVVVPLADAAIAGHLEAGPDGHDWGTYTYDIAVWEYLGETPPASAAEALDGYGLKTPYTLWVPDEGDDGQDGHLAWMTDPEDGGTPELRLSYWLKHQAPAHTPAAEEVAVVLLDGSLTAHAPLLGALPGAVATRHAGPDADEDGTADGITVLEVPAGLEGDVWRVIWTASDPYGVRDEHRRTHDARRMLAANQPATRHWNGLAVQGMGTPAGGLSASGIAEQLRSAGYLVHRGVPPGSDPVSRREIVGYNAAPVLGVDDLVAGHWANMPGDSVRIHMGDVGMVTTWEISEKLESLRQILIYPPYKYAIDRSKPATGKMAHAVHLYGHTHHGHFIVSATPGSWGPFWIHEQDAHYVGNGSAVPEGGWSGPLHRASMRGNRLVILQACYTAQPGSSLLNRFVDAGAGYVIGFTGQTFNGEPARLWAEHFYQEALEDRRTLQQAFDNTRRWLQRLTPSDSIAAEARVGYLTAVSGGLGGHLPLRP